MNHPYKNFPAKSFWKNGVQNNFIPAELLSQPFSEILRRDDKIVSAGSCFASNLIPYLESAGYQYLREEVYPSALSDLAENLGYAKFSARYGFIYTARHLLQTYKKALGLFESKENYWTSDSGFIDPYRPGLPFIAETKEEFDAIQAAHFNAIKMVFHSATVFIFTLGLTESWISVDDGSAFPACPGTISGEFDPSRHQFHNFEYPEVVSDLNEFIGLMREHNPAIKFIFTVSPVHLVATAENQHVLLSSIYSKSVLRSAVQKVVSENAETYYFPAYEIVTGPQTSGRFIASDLREVTQEGIDLVMSLFIGENKTQIAPVALSKQQTNILEDLVKRECDEAFLDVP